jgi:transcriptional regulator GlxA family with amidase domain
VVVLGFDDALLLNAAGPLEVFGAVPRLLAGAFAQHPPYRLVLASPEGGLISTVSGIEVMTRSLTQLDLELRDIDTLIVAGGPGVAALEADPRACDWLRRRHGQRACSMAVGW